MGIGGISPTQLLIILAIVLVLFGTKRLRNVGSDLGSAVKGFKKAIKDDNKDAEQPNQVTQQSASETDGKTASTVDKKTNDV